jgi:CRP/FNR family cyclic AMP-dependent transcriptional regulator
MADQKIQDYIPDIKKNIIFEFLKPKEFKKILGICKIENYKEGQKIISKGEVSNTLYAVLKGTVNVTSQQPNGKETYISVIGQGDVFGEAGIFIKVKRTANVVSAGDTTLLSIHRDDLIPYVKEYSNAGVKILMLIIYSLLRKLKEANQEIAFERKSDISQEDIDTMVESVL